MTSTMGALANRHKGTVSILFTRTGKTGGVRLGNVTAFDPKQDIQRVAHMSALVGDAGGGVAVEDGNIVTTVARKFGFTVDEMTNDTLGLLQLAAAASAANQSAAATQAVTVDNVEVGGTYYLGYVGLTAHALTKGVTPLVVGTDIAIDYASGLVTVLSGGALADGDDITGTVNAPAVNYKTHTALSELRVTGSATIQIWDQFVPKGGAPRTIITIASCELYATDWGTINHDKYREVKLEINCLSNPVLKERQDT